MKVKLRNYSDCWQDIKDATMTTINKDRGSYPNEDWKRRLLLSEHSPIRKLKVSWKWYELPYYVSTHFVRHFIGLIHFVGTQRTDRTGINRDELPQGNLVQHEVDGNAQSLIAISRKRECMCASAETRKAWRLVKEEVSKVEPELASVMVKECVYRNGLCPEMYSCGYNKTPAFEIELKAYISGMEHQVNPKTLIE